MSNSFNTNASRELRELTRLVNLTAREQGMGAAKPLLSKASALPAVVRYGNQRKQVAKLKDQERRSQRRHEERDAQKRVVQDLRACADL